MTHAFPTRLSADLVYNLARLIRGDLSQVRRKLDDDGTAPLTGAALRRAVAGKTLLYSTVYGEPCTIELRRNGELVGVAGHAQDRSEEHTSELQSLMRNSYAVFCLSKTRNKH